MKNLGTIWFRGFFVACKCYSFFLRCILRKADAAYACVGTPNAHRHTDVFPLGVLLRGVWCWLSGVDGGETSGPMESGKQEAGLLERR